MRKKGIIIGAVSAGVILLGGGGWALGNFVILPEMRYKDAVALYEDEEFQKAKTAFEEMGDYKDAEEMILACQYGIAEEAMQDEKWKKAAELFEELDDYEDSENCVLICQYALAEEAMQDEDWETASEMFEALDDYQDAQEQLTFCETMLQIESGSLYYMPDLVGMNYYDAQDLYPYIDIQIGETEYTEFEIDSIYFQEIASEELVSYGQTVYVSVSLGLEMPEIPDVSNMYYEDAVALIEQKGFDYEIRYEVSENGIEENYVTRTEPGSGEAAIDTTIVIYVSMGIADGIIMEDFVGLTIEEAQLLCDYYGLYVEYIAADHQLPEGTIFEQSIAPGESVSAGSSITLTYSTGIAPTEETTTLYYTLVPPVNEEGSYLLDLVSGEYGTLGTICFDTPREEEVIIALEGMGVYTIYAILTNTETGAAAEIGRYEFDFVSGSIEPVSEDIAVAFAAVSGTTES